MIISITGKYCSGKDTVADILKEKGFLHISLSDLIREEAAKRNMPATRENLILLGNELRKQFGAGVLAQRAVEGIRADKNYVITSIRNPGEVDVLKTKKDFVLVNIDVSLDIRWQRMQQRPNRPDALKTFEDFVRFEKEEAESSDPAHIQIDKVIGMADIVIDNCGSLEELKKKVNANMLSKL
ncbi:MAG: AAA family ATPase [Candidatus Aenigmarchaeota archaeon]|nr:AAA family ATPase [Candidatus Aenigmarchaeota archaeon]